MSEEFIKHWELRIGNGNDGNYFTNVITMNENDDPYIFMEMVIPNLFNVGHRARSHAYKYSEVGGDSEYGIYATLYEGLGGISEMGAAYKTAQLLPLPESDLGFYQSYEITNIKGYLDRGSFMKYNKKLSQKKK